MAAPSAKVEALIARLIEREGGYVNHPADRGGPTKYGVTLDTLTEWRGKAASAAEVEHLGLAEARDIYRDRYFRRPGFDAVADAALQELLFDTGVHSGPGAAARALQLCLQRMGLYAGRLDGDVGPMTRAAIAACADPRELYYRLKCERHELLLRLIGRDPRQAAFAAGWANRLDELEYS